MLSPKNATSVVRRGSLIDCTVKRRRRNLKKVKISVDAGLERLKVVLRWNDGCGKRVPASKINRDKRVGECVYFNSLNNRYT